MYWGMMNQISSVTKTSLFVRYGPFLALFAAIYIMILLGGATRLTGSGLSMVNWQPIRGILPPLTLDQWVETFRRYQGTPEYQHINYGMTLGEFQSIFWLEYIHRVWGRFIGVLLVVCTWSAYRHFPHLLKPVAYLWGLGICQGLMGWYMVKSGLVQDPYVSPYRLTAHLFLGLLTLSLAFWCTYQTLPLSKKRWPISSHLYSLLMFLCCLLICTVAYGGLVAGFKAGLMYNTFPLMEGWVIPPDLFFYDPWWSNFILNSTTIQWTHRFLALTSLCLYMFILGLGHRHRFILNLGILLLIQIALGALTICLQVPFLWAFFHQGWALCLVLYTLLILWRSEPEGKMRKSIST